MALLIQPIQGKDGPPAGPDTGRRRVSARRRQAFSRLLLIVVCVGLWFHSDAAAQEPPSEYSVKAAFLLNFIKFIDWPAESFERPDSPLAICILGVDPFGRTLDTMIEGESVNGHKLTVQRIQDTPARGSCQVLFFSASEKPRSRALKDLGPGILSVGEAEGFLADGGILNFAIENRRVRFDVSIPAADRARLKLSSKLLSVARSVQK